MKYIKNAIKDSISRVTRDCIKNYKTGTAPSLEDMLKDVKKLRPTYSDLVEVYPWETFPASPKYTGQPKFYEVRGKWFIEQAEWDDRVALIRHTSYHDLVEHVRKSKKVILKQYGPIAWIKSWFGKDPVTTQQWVKGEQKAAKNFNWAKTKKILADYNKM